MASVTFQCVMQFDKNSTNGPAIKILYSVFYFVFLCVKCVYFIIHKWLLLCIFHFLCFTVFVKYTFVTMITFSVNCPFKYGRARCWCVNKVHSKKHCDARSTMADRGTAVTVLTPNGRRQVVKVCPNTPLLQVIWSLGTLSVVLTEFV